MWLPDEPAALELAMQNEQTFFILQAWHELLSPTSPDSYQARVVDLSLLLDDVIHVAETGLQSKTWEQYLPSLADEIKERAAREKSFLNLHPRLAHAIENVVARAKSRDVRGSLESAHVARGIYGNAISELIEDARSLARDKPKMRLELLHRLNTIASHIQYHGSGDASLEMVGTKLLELAPADAIDSLVAPVLRGKQKYECTLFVSEAGREVGDIFAGSDVRLVDNAKFKRHDDLIEWRSFGIGKVTISTVVKAMSSGQAAEQALARVAQRINAYNLHTNSAGFEVGENVLTVDERRRRHVITVSPRRRFGLLPRREMPHLFQERMQSIGERLDGRLSNALESHALALAARDPRTAIVNLWTALETIAGPYGNGSIGDRVVSKIAPLITWRRVDKIITYLAVHAHSARWKLGKDVDTTSLEFTDDDAISPDDVLSAVTGPDENPAAKNLLKIAGNSPLWRQRFMDVWGEFHRPDRFGNGLLQTQRMVSWQIQRLYRARNLLVHRGEQSHLIWRLLQNAQYYVSVSLNRIMHDLAENEAWTIDTSLVHQNERLSYLTTYLKADKAHCLSHGDFLLEKSACPARRVWSPPSTSPTTSAQVASVPPDSAKEPAYQPNAEVQDIAPLS
jgi:hypothetical protein